MKYYYEIVVNGVQKGIQCETRKQALDIIELKKMNKLLKDIRAIEDDKQLQKRKLSLADYETIKFLVGRLLNGAKFVLFIQNSIYNYFKKYEDEIETDISNDGVHYYAKLKNKEEKNIIEKKKEAK